MQLQTFRLKWSRYIAVITSGILLNIVGGTNINAAELTPEETYATHGLASFEKKVTDINDSGTVTGRAAIHTNSDTESHAVSWDNTGALTDLDPQSLSFNSIANGINNSGDVVAQFGGRDQLINFEGPALFTQGSMVELYDQNGLKNTLARAQDINDNGLIVGCADYVPLQWDNSPFATVISGTPENTPACASTANNKNEIIGYTFINRQQHAVLWRAGNMINLGTLPGHESSIALGINDLGQIVGASSDLDGSHGNETLPFLWENGVLTPLGTLSGNYGIAADINNRGEIVGRAPVPFLYRDGVMYDLSKIVSPVLFSDAVAINESGQIAGTAYVLTPAPNQLDLVIEKTGPLQPVDSGTLFTYEITVNNRSTVDGNNVVVSDRLNYTTGRDTALELVSAVPSQGSCAITVPLDCQLGTVPAEATATITLTLKGQLSFSRNQDPVSVSSTAHVVAENTDVNGTNNYSYTNTYIIPPAEPEGADLATTLSGSVTRLSRNSKVTFVTKVVNNGTLTANNAIYTHDINTRYKKASITTSHGSCTTNKTIHCELGDLPAGDVVTIELTVNVSDDARFFSSARVSSDSYDPDSQNNSSAILITVQP